MKQYVIMATWSRMTNRSGIPLEGHESIYVMSHNNVTSYNYKHHLASITQMLTAVHHLSPC